MIRKSSKKGFSLVELLVVITIIAILSVVAYTAIGGQTIKARNAKRLQDLSSIQSALQVYYAENNKYPSNPLTSGTNIAAGLIPKKYLSEIPKDPGGKDDYKYGVTASAYQLGATIEDENDPTIFKAYVVGNSDTDLIPGVGVCGGANVPNGSAACLPYLLTD